MRKTLTSLLVLFWSHLCFADLLPESLRRSVFKISVVSQAADLRSPWIQSEPSSGTGSGFYIGERRIITNAHVVAGARYITVQRDGDPEPRRARLVFIAHDSDLALLTVAEADYFRGMKPMEFGGIPKLHSSVATVGYPRGGEQLSITEGVTSRISYQTYVHDGDSRHLLIQVDSAINPGNSGGPVVQSGKVVGVAFQAYTKAENTGYMIPIPVLKRFLTDVADGTYEGHPVIGARIWRWSVANPGARKWYGLEDADGGVKIAALASWSPWRKALQAGDVLLKVDENSVGIDGKIKLYGERVDLRVLYDLKLHGDKVKFHILRDREKKTIELTVEHAPKHYAQRVQYPLHPKFFVYSGLVFTELSVNFLKSWGTKWYQNAPLYLRYLHYNSTWDQQFADREGFVVLSRVLPNSLITWLQRQQYAAVDQVNGTSVKNITHFAELMSQATGVVKITFLDGRQPIVLDSKLAKEAQDQILAKYKVPRSMWLDETDSAYAATLKSEKSGDTK